ncbi:hypothetical protein MPLDJ20_110369 [Mesorhizobium plurifarium]|uniref:Uncharacterized protein n=1 Tax=Mesorhizobium plurifarium TaxID=69974 RepID=A0A090FQM4_MESPL|nr:hypothetical protein MPLDJ20_110369 [Mesorhizobium plurifarium]
MLVTNAALNPADTCATVLVKLNSDVGSLRQRSYLNHELTHQVPINFKI